jgi:hypothetical protein
MTYRRMTLTSLMRSRGALVIGLIVSVTACASKPIVAPPPKEVEGVSDTVLQPLSYLQLNAAANVFRVAFDRSLDSWQGAVDEAGLKCAISGPMAERALAALRPWLDQRAAEEATKLTDNPQSYKMPASAWPRCEFSKPCLKIIGKNRVSKTGVRFVSASSSSPRWSHPNK